MNELIFTEDQIKKIEKIVSAEISKLQVDRAIFFNFSYFEGKFDNINKGFVKLEKIIVENKRNIKKILDLLKKYWEG